MRITVIGLGIVGLSDALSLGRRHEVVVTGPVPDRIDAINRGDFLIRDPGLSAYLAAHPLRIRATLDTAEALQGADLVLITSPLTQDPETGAYRTVELESRIEFAHARCPGVPIVIRSAVPIGFTEAMQARLGPNALTCAPEFRREGASLTDALHPRHVTVGDRGPLGAKVGRALASAALADEVPVRRIGPAEAEAVTHFARAYLAARVAYFNELDSYALAHDLNARQVIDGVCLDPRIGRHANNPCFGYGGEGLPRSARHLGAHFGGVPMHVMAGTPRANAARVEALAERVMAQGATRIGLYRPGTAGPMAALAARLRERGAEVVSWDAGAEGLAAFAEGCDRVVATRAAPELAGLGDKLFCRDLYAA